jgi:hypothetical protein
MKKLFVSLLAFTGFLFPLLAQVDHDQNMDDKVPVESFILRKDQVPAAIRNAVNSDFATGEAFRWAKFPFVLEKYGWVIAKDESGQPPDQYDVNIKAKDGSDIYAIYSSDGTIIQSRTIRKNAILPESVSMALKKSQYKDWTVVGDKEIIKYWNTKNDIEEHYRITVEKNNVKKTISFNYKDPVTN